MKQVMTRWQWYQLDHICTSLKIDNHASTSSLNFFTRRMLFLMPNHQCQSSEGSRNESRYRDFWKPKLTTVSTDVWIITDGSDSIRMTSWCWNWEAEWTTTNKTSVDFCFTFTESTEPSSNKVQRCRSSDGTTSHPWRKQQPKHA